MTRNKLRHLIACSLAFSVAREAAAEKAERPKPRPGDKTVTLAAGARYEASGIWGFFFGRDYRRLWTTPVEVPVLDLATFGGGLEAKKKGGGRQTKALNFKGANGRDYKFRSIDKDPSEALPKELRGGQVEGLAQDQTSSGHPGALLVMSPLLRAAGLLSVRWRMVVLPDSPALGEFREEFAGMLGTIEEDPDSDEPEETPGFEQIKTIIETEKLFEILRKDASERLDTRAYLRARLVDMFVNDWDRHAGQWDWGKSERDGLWKPIPKDRDQAFSRYDGVLVAVARKKAAISYFDKDIDHPLASSWVARDLDRRFLSGLSQAVWVEEAQDLSRRFTNDVIAAAVRQLPREYYAQNGAWLTEILQERRDRLVDAAKVWYLGLSESVDVFGTDEAERLEATRSGDTLTLRLVPKDDPERPTLVREFREEETDEVRVYLQGGDDEAVVTGQGQVTLRVIGGEGHDLVDDAAAGGTRVYDAEGENVVKRGDGTRVRSSAYDEAEPPKEPRPRDWGHTWATPLWVSAGSDLGLFVGAGITRQDYGFRKQPYARRQTIRAGYATGASRFRADYLGDFRREQSTTSINILARMSGIDVVRFYGFGNETTDIGGDEFYKVHQSLLTLAPNVDFDLSIFRARVGPKIRYSWTRDDPTRFIDRLQPYGFGRFGEAGLQASLDWDRRNDQFAPTKGARLFVGGTTYAPVWSVEEPFGEVRGEASGAVTARPLLESTLAARVGGKKVFGTYPYFESAFIGGARQEPTVRGLEAQRYAGDASLYGNAELRIRLFNIPILVPTDIGIYGLVDAGRVYLDGSSPGGWHTGVGGGLWFAPMRGRNSLILTITMARSEGRTGTYFRAGFPF